MVYLKKYRCTDTYMTPSCAIMDGEEAKRQFPAITRFTHVVQTDESGEMMFALQNLSAMRNQYGIESSLGTEEAVSALQAVLNAPAPEPDPTAEERIAAAMEYQNLVNM